MADLDQIVAEFEACGGTDVAYLRHHLPRFQATVDAFAGSWDMARGCRAIDIGAHWLHQSWLLREAGFEVTAVDLPATFETHRVIDFAAAHDIKLVMERDLSRCEALQSLPADSIDVVFFTEILEHITFNPVAMWKAVYRLMAPGARIVISTPNYYAWRGRAWDWGRFAKGFGGGIEADQIFSTPTYGHHWKEYALRELIRYFCVLSPDLNTIKAVHVEEFAPGYLGKPAGRITTFLERNIPGLRPNLHLEVELTQKSAGIVIEPNW